MEMVVEDDAADHGAQAEHVRVLALKPASPQSAAPVEDIHSVANARETESYRDGDRRNALSGVDHGLADVGHGAETGGDVVLEVRVLVHELARRVVDDVHHRRRVREEERHLVRQLVADRQLMVLLRHLHTVQAAPVVREVVLDRRVHHLRDASATSASKRTRRNEGASSE